MASICSVSGFDASGVVTDAEVEDMLRQLPDTHVRTKALRSVQYLDDLREEEPRHRRFPKHQIFGEWSINERTGEGSASVFRQHSTGNPDQPNFLATILHEVGHAVYYKLPEVEKIEWVQLHSSSVIIMNEQSRAPDEHFCHMYAAYFLRNEFVRSIYGHFYPFLKDRIFEGKEYADG